MHAKILLSLTVGLCLFAACARKPTLEECLSAMDRMGRILGKEAIERMKKSINEESPYAGQLREDMDKQIREIDAAPPPEKLDDRNLRECQRQTQKRVLCVAKANGVEELVKTCGMKQSEGADGQGDVTVHWPD